MAVGTDVLRMRRKVLLVSGGLFALVFWTFLPALHNRFVDYDDPLYVTENVIVQRGVTWAGLDWALRRMAAANWHPVTWVSHMVDCQLFELNPWGHHLTSVALHALNSTLLFLVLRKMTSALWPSALPRTLPPISRPSAASA